MKKKGHADLADLADFFILLTITRIKKQKQRKPFSRFSTMCLCRTDMNLLVSKLPSYSCHYD